MTDRQKRILNIFLLTSFCVLVNSLGSFLSKKVTFPLYLDSILTIFLVAKIGLIPGIICAFLTNGVTGFFITSTLFPFCLCHISTAIIAYFVFKYYKEKSLDAFLYSGVFSAVSNGILGNFISIYVVRKSTIPLVQTDYVIQGLYIASQKLIFSIYFSGIITNLVDKILSAAISFLMFKFIFKEKSYSK